MGNRIKRRSSERSIGAVEGGGPMRSEGSRGKQAGERINLKAAMGCPRQTGM